MDLIHNFFLLTQVLIGSVEVCQLRVALSLLKKMWSAYVAFIYLLLIVLGQTSVSCRCYRSLLCDGFYYFHESDKKNT